MTEAPQILPLPGCAPDAALGVGRRLCGAWVEHRAHALLAHARANSPFYRRHWGSWRAGRSSWTSLPPVDKHLLMAHFDGWVTDRDVSLGGVRAFIADSDAIGHDYLGRYAVWCSSGTSGEPGIFLHDSAALATYTMLSALRMDAGYAAAHLLPGLWQGGARCALVAAIDGHYAGVSFWRRQMRLAPWLQGRSVALSVTQPRAQLCAALDAFQPALLASYPSMLVELADGQRRGLLHIAPAALWAGGESLAPAERALLLEVFHAPAANDYGCSEALTIAAQCRHGRLHVNDDWVLLEPVDAHGRAVPPGEASASVLLTNLVNRIAPIIRYDLGDSILVHADACRCGNPRPSITVQGRCDDMLHLRDDDGGEAVLSPLALVSAIEEQAHVCRFQLLQTGPATLALRLDAAEQAARPAVLAALRQQLRSRGLSGVQLDADMLPPQPEPRGGKLRRVIALQRAPQRPLH